MVIFRYNGTDVELDIDPAHISPEVLLEKFFLDTYPQLRGAGHRVYTNNAGVTVYEYSRTNGDKGGTPGSV